MSIDVYVSVGRTQNEEQENFVQDVERHLTTQGLNPRTLGRNQWSSEQPLKAVRKIMATCSGTVIVAYERIFAEEAWDRRQSTSDKSHLEKLKLTTVWNQIEAALAYGMDQPLLVIVEEGIREEGLLEKGYDWWALRIPMSVASLSSPQFSGVLADWRRRVEERAKNKPDAQDDELKHPDFDLNKRSVAEIIGMLTATQLWALLSTVATAIAAVAVAAYQVGRATGKVPG